MRRLLFAVVPLLMAPVPKDAIEYKSDGWTQSIFVLNNVRVIRPVKIEKIDSKWHQSGGMLGIKGYKSVKFKTLPSPPTQKLDFIPVGNGPKSFQNELGIVRSYADGSRFDDVLYNSNGVVFEHRVREKIKGRWISRIEYREILARPEGYDGLKTSCASCHDEAGTGPYGEGLVPGGDTVLSDPFDWEPARRYFK